MIPTMQANLIDCLAVNGVVSAQLPQADLSRVRQEKLPLSNIEKRGPSYNPTGKNSTSKYSRVQRQTRTSKYSHKYMDKLGSSWNSKSERGDPLPDDADSPLAPSGPSGSSASPGPMPPRQKLGGLEFKPIAPGNPHLPGWKAFLSALRKLLFYAQSPVIATILEKAFKGNTFN
ncbi:hypothetical protein NM208_g3331 [Fusarium decemcellulare]|uniref:Uncharacterized protein n=1 Tax=Fusarium decemcellulare TaxID=57161 RepID=A0ACC1SPL5_9HYPO|nr:hypothetical protein NM208_g3331 [Fusarium decemcellulare]